MDTIMKVIGAIAVAAVMVAIMNARQKNKKKSAMEATKENRIKDILQSKINAIDEEIERLNHEAALIISRGIDEPVSNTAQRRLEYIQTQSRRIINKRNNMISLIDCTSAAQQQVKSIVTRIDKSDLLRMLNSGKRKEVIAHLNEAYQSNVEADADDELLKIIIDSISSASQIATDELNIKKQLVKQSFQVVQDEVMDLVERGTTKETKRALQKQQDTVSLLHLAVADNEDLADEDGIQEYPNYRIKLLLREGYDEIRGDLNPAQVISSINDPERSKLVTSEKAFAHKDLIERIEKGEQHIPFFHTRGGHFVAGAIVKDAEEQYHLIVIDPCSVNDQENEHSSTTRYLLEQLKKDHIHIPQSNVHASYDVLKISGKAVPLQSDGYNCGAWTTELLAKLDDESCAKIVKSGIKGMNEVIRKTIGDANPNQWTEERSEITALEMRRKQNECLFEIANARNFNNKTPQR